MPWLLINYKVSFISDQKKDIYYPLGFNLVTGDILNQFDGVFTQFQLTPKIPDYHFTLRPIFSLRSAITHVEQHIHQFLATQDKIWAAEANQRLDEEKELIQLFFENSGEEEQQILENKVEEIDSYRPRIDIEPINLGLIYLQTDPMSRIR